MSPLQLVRRGAARRVALVPMNPLEQLRAGHLVRRVTQLLVGLLLFGVTMALLLRAGLGLEPWGVLTYGLVLHVPMSYGQMVIASSFVVLLLWVPLRQWPGLGTVLNAVVIGLATDATLGIVPPIDGLGWRVLVVVLGVVGNGVAGALYIGSQLGPGPRDGLMTGLSRRTGRSIRLVRTGLEVTVVTLGWLLGGVVGIGTLLYALLIGPVVQFFLPLLTVRLDPPRGAQDEAAEGSRESGSLRQDHTAAAKAESSSSDGHPERPAQRGPGGVAARHRELVGRHERGRPDRGPDPLTRLEGPTGRTAHPGRDVGQREGDVRRDDGATAEPGHEQRHGEQDPPARSAVGRRDEDGERDETGHHHGEGDDGQGAADPADQPPGDR